MKRKIHNGYYKQILLALLFISLIPVLFFGYYVYSFVNQQMEAVYKSYVAKLENNKEEFETSFEYVDVSLLRLGLKGSCQNAVNKERKAPNFQIFNTMQVDLSLIKTTEKYLDNVFLVSQNQNWILGETFLEPLEKYPDNKLIQKLFLQRQVSFWHSEGEHLYLCKKVPINAIKGNGMLIACFDKNAMIQEIVGDDEGGSFLILDQNGQILLGSEGYEGINQAMASPDESRRIYQDMDITSIRYNDQHYIVLKSISDRMGWSYVLAMPEKEILANTRGILYMVGLVILGLLMTDVTVVLTLSRRLYLPIEEIDMAVSKGLGDTEEMAKGLKEGTELMDRVQYMVNQNAEMNRRLTHGKKDRQQLFLRRVYQGEILNPDQQLFADNGFDLTACQDGIYFVMAIKYHNQFEDAEDKQLYLFALDNIVSELVNNKETFPPVVIGSLMYLTCCVSTESSESAVMKVQMTAIMITTTVKKYINMPLNIGISQGFTNLQNITLGINESNKALQDAMGAEGEVNFYHSHHTTRENTKEYAAKKKRVQILHYIDMGDRDACKKELDAYIDGLSGLYYYIFKLELCKLVSEVLSIYHDYSLVPDYNKVGDIIDFDIGKTINTYERLKEYMWGCLMEPLFDTICSEAQERDQWQQIIEYLLDNLEKDISLDECARHFNYNANYLSRWFKKKMGMTYTEFITSKKMELCKTLLADSDVSVNELAERFGYSSPQNFIRVFKKYTLMTPGQYRKAEREKIKIYNK